MHRSTTKPHLTIFFFIHYLPTSQVILRDGSPANGVAPTCSSTALDVPRPLANVGNSCWMGATIHCLGCIEDIRKGILSGDIAGVGGGSQIIAALRCAFQSMHGPGPNHTDSIVIPHALRRSLANTWTDYDGPIQHDADEALLRVLQLLHEQTSQGEEQPEALDDDFYGDDDQLEEHVAEKAAAIVGETSSPVFGSTGLFEVGLLTCPHCSTRRVQVCPLLSCTLRGGQRCTSISDCFEQRSRAESVKLEQPCSSCYNDGHQFLKSVHLYSPPEYFVITLSSAGSTFNSTSMNNIDLSSHFVGQPRDAKYDVVAVGDHHNVDGILHWTAKVQLTGGEFWHYDDSVTPLAADKAGVMSETTRVMILRRTDVGREGIGGIDESNLPPISISDQMQVGNESETGEVADDAEDAMEEAAVAIATARSLADGPSSDTSSNGRDRRVTFSDNEDNSVIDFNRTCILHPGNGGDLVDTDDEDVDPPMLEQAVDQEPAAPPSPSPFAAEPVPVAAPTVPIGPSLGNTEEEDDFTMEEAKAEAKSKIQARKGSRKINQHAPIWHHGRSRGRGRKEKADARLVPTCSSNEFDFEGDDLTNADAEPASPSDPPSQPSKSLSSMPSSQPSEPSKLARRRRKKSPVQGRAFGVDRTNTTASAAPAASAASAGSLPPPSTMGVTDLIKELKSRGITDPKKEVGLMKPDLVAEVARLRLEKATAKAKAKAKVPPSTTETNPSAAKAKGKGKSSSSKSKRKASDAKKNVARVSSLSIAKYSYDADDQLLVTIPVEALPPAVPDAVDIPTKDGYATMVVHPEIARMIKRGTYQNFDFRAIRRGNGLAELMYNSPMFIQRCRICAKNGWPMPYLPEVYGPDKEGKMRSLNLTLAQIKALVKRVDMLHFAGDLHSYQVQTDGLLCLGINGRGEEFIREPCIRFTVDIRRNMCDRLNLGPEAAAIAEEPTLLCDLFPFVLDRDNHGNELNSCPEVKDAVRDLWKFILPRFFPSAFSNVSVPPSEALNLQQLTIIGLGTREDLDDLMADISIDLSPFCPGEPISHPASVMKGIPFAAGIATLAGYAAVFQDQAITDKILNLSKKEVERTYGSMAAILLGNAVKVIFSDGKYILMTSQSQVGEAIGDVSPKTIRAWLRGERQNGTELSEGEKEQGLTGTRLGRIQIEASTQSFGLASADPDCLGIHSVQGARRLADDHGNGLNSADTKVGGKGGFRNEPEWLKNAKNRELPVNLTGASVVYIDVNDQGKEAKALFNSGNDASRHSHKDGGENLIKNAIHRKGGLFGESSTSKHEDLRAVEVTNLDRVVGEALAKRIRAQIVGDEMKLRSGEYLASYEKNTQASNDRKKRRRKSAAS